MASVKLFYNLKTTAAKPSLAIPSLKVLCSKVAVALKMSTTCLTVLYIPILESGFSSQPSCGQYSITFPKLSLAIPSLKVICSQVAGALKMSTTCLTLLYIPILVSGFLSQPSYGQYSITFPKLSLAIPSLKVICSQVAGALKMSTTCLTLLYIPILVSGFLSQPSYGQYSITFPKLV